MDKLSDDAFLQFAEAQEKEATSKKSEFSTPDYEKIKWTGLEKGRMKLIRAVGGPPDSKIDRTTAKTVRISKIIGDNGKQFRCIFPERGQDPDHILWKIMAKVNAVTWNNNVKTYVHEFTHPTSFNAVNKNGLNPSDKRFRFERGWVGRHVVIMNVIDREMMDWHRKNKHTALLSRNISMSKDGRAFPDEGVPSYGFLGPISLLFKYYKSWQRYDMGVLRTGRMESPYHIVNAGVNIVEVPEDLQDKVSKEMLTQEEAEWERYDLEKLFGYTSNTKIYNRLKDTIGKIDADLGTHFLAELKEKSDIEKAQWEKEKVVSAPAKEPVAEPVANVQERVSTPKETPARAPVEAPRKKLVGEHLKGYENLTPEEKNKIEDVVVKDGKVVDIVYKDTDEAVMACPNCKVASPASFQTCPNCGLSFV